MVNTIQTFSSNLEYLSVSDLNISEGGILFCASFAACNEHSLISLEHSMRVILQDSEHY